MKKKEAIRLVSIHASDIERLIKGQPVVTKDDGNYIIRLTCQEAVRYCRSGRENT